MNTLKKIVAITTIVSSLLMTSGPALAVTAEELQAQIDALLAQLSSLQSQLAELQGETPTVTGCTITSFDRNLKLGMSGDDVKCLQIVLNSSADTQLASSGVGSPGNETSYFGPLTQAAVIKFQEKYADEVLASWGLTSGTGFVGSTTRAKLDSLLGVVTPPAGVVCGNGVCETGETYANCPADCPVAPVSGLSVALSGTDPATKVAAMGSQDVTFSTYRLVAGTSGAVTISSITVHRGGIAVGGISDDTDFTNLKLFRNSTSTANKIGATLTLNTTTHSAKFSNLNWTINAGQSDTLIITGSLNTSGITGNVLMLGLDSASDIVVDEEVSGTFPTYGSKVSPATQAVGALALDVLSTPGDISPLSGATDQGVATIQFEASSTEDFRVDSIKITQIGSAIPADLSNITLKYGNTVLAVIPQLEADNTGIFNISAPANENIIKKSQTRKFWVYVDIASGITTGRTIDISVQQASDIVAVGTTSGGVVTVEKGEGQTAGDGVTYAADSGATHIISRGSYTAAISAAYNPAATTYIVGTEDNKVTALRFSASNTEAVRITQLTITEGDDISYTDISSIKLAKVSEGGGIGETLAEGVLSSSETVQFGVNEINAFDSDWLFEVPKGGNYDVWVLVSLPASADTNDGMKFSIAANTDVKADGVTTQNDLAACTSCTATGNIHEIDANGIVTLSNSPTTAATVYVKGAQDKEFARFSFTVSDGEDIEISALTLTAVDSGNSALSTANSPTDVRVYKESVAPENLLGSVASPANGVANFSFTDVISKSTTRNYIVTADIPTTTSASTMSIEIDAEADTTATGVSSGATGTAVTDGTWSVQGNDMTISQGTLGVIASGLPVYTNVTEKSNNVEVARFVLTSGANGETVRVSSFKVTLKGTAGNSKSVDTADLSQITLYDVNGGDIAPGGVKTKVIGSLTSSAATFTGLAIDIPSGSQKVLGIKVNIGDSARTTPNIVMGVENYYTDIAASGLDSLSTVYANQLVHGTSGILATLFAESAVDDLDLTGNVTDADDELNAYGVPALGISAVGDGDIITIESEHIFVTTASNGTVVRNGFAGTTAAAHSTTGVPIILHIGSHTVSESANDFATNSDASLITASSTAATIRAGMLLAQEDPDVAAASDDLKLVTAISSDGKTHTLTDAYVGAVFAEDTDDDAFVISMTNYGQAQKLQAVGTLTLAVDSGTPAVAQVVAGSSDVEFSRVKLTAAYESVGITKIVFTRTGGTGTDSYLGAGSDNDFASVYLQNLTDSTWGPNGNGKSNVIQVTGGKATFNFSADDAITVDYLSSTGTSIALKGNLNTVITGVTSGDAPKFYIAALNTTNLTATGSSTGTTLTSFTAGTPTPATATNFNAQVILKGVLDAANYDCSSCSGSETRSAGQTIQELDLVSASTGSVATFRAGTVNACTATTTDFSPTPAGSDLDGDWAVVTGDDVSTIAASATNRIGSAGNSILFTQKDTATNGEDAGEGVQYASVNLDLSDYTGMAFWFRTSQVADDLTLTLTGADAGSYTIDVSGLEADHWFFIDVPFSDATTPFTGLAEVTAFKVVSATAMAADDTFNIDDLYFYKDKVKVSLSSNGGLDGTDTAQHATSATLRDGGTILATAYYSGNLSSTAAAETNAGHLTFIPTSQFTIPSGGKRLSVVADTTALITAVDKTLTKSVDLGSVNSNGAVTDGDIFWWDESFDLTDNSIRWVDSTPNPVSGGTISY
jgi:hypothetical protein